jgi:PAS domain-containing protein
VPYLLGLMVVIASVGVIITKVWVGLAYAGLSLASIVILGQLSPVPLPQELEALVATATVLAAVVMGVHRTAAARRVAIAHIARGRAVLEELVQAIPDPVFVRTQDMTLLFANEAGRRLETASGYDLGPVFRQELAAVAAASSLEQDVEVRTVAGTLAMSVKTAVAGAGVGTGAGHAMLVTVVRDVTERREMAEALRRRVRELEETRERLKKLQQMMPICMHCTNIRVSDGHWETLELFVSKSSKTTFTHTLCPSCLERHYPALEGIENPD